MAFALELETQQPPYCYRTAIQKCKNNINNPYDGKSSKKSNDSCNNISISTSNLNSKEPSRERKY